MPIIQTWSNWWEKWTNFTEKQKLAEKLIDDYGYFFYGGAAGPGKSYFLRKYPIKFLTGVYQKLGLKGVRAGLFCEDYPSLWDRHINRIKYEFPNWLGEYKDKTHEFILNEKYGGGVLAFRNLDDPSKYLSAEFALIAVDELTKNPKETFDFLRLRKRWTGIKKTKFIGASNPGGIGHQWVKDLWIDRKYDVNEKEQNEFYFLKAFPSDNPYLEKSYLTALDSLPEKLRKAYKEGNWDVFAGQYFSEWNRDYHIINPFLIPEHWKKFRSYDHGRENPACCSWYALDGDGRVYKYREFYKSGLNVDQIAAEINRLSEGEKYEYSVADPSIFAHTGFVDKSGGQTIAETFARYGIVFLPASNRRIDGWNLMHQYLFYDKERMPKLVYFNTCVNSIRTLPSLIHDERRPEDLDTKGEDHCFAGETLIDTFWGRKRIKDLIGKNIYVNTLEGFKKCRSVRKTRKTQIWEILLSNGKIIKATPDHRFFTTNGWKELKDIDINNDYLIQLDVCIKSYLILFKNLMELAIIYVVNTFKKIIGDYIKIIGDYMLQFGNIIKVIFKKDFISTIKTEIDVITIFLIFQKFQHSNIYLYTQELQKRKNGQERTLKKQDPLRFNGINQMREESGIVITPKNKLKNGYGLIKFAKFAAETIKRLNSLLIGQSSVISIVKCAPCGEEEVYNLTVPIIENFTINNGIVVHNCADSDRYMLMSLHERKGEKTMNEVEKKLEEFKRTQNVSPTQLNQFYY